MEPNNGLSGAKIALLVDFDNVVLGLEDPGFDIELVVNALRERGTIVLGRVYGDWYRHNRHRRRLMEQGLELVETPAFGPVIKNSADIRIALDGYEIGLTQSHIDTFAIVSGDSDFLPLIKKLQSLGRRVLVICGNRFTSDMLRRNCNEFISYENLLAQSVGATEDATTLEGAFSLLHRAMEALRERGTEIRGSGVKQMMIQLNPVFSERTFGCTQFRQFLQKAVQNGVVKLGPRDKVSGEFHVLLPDEDEAPIQQKMDRRAENRARRDEKIATIVARVEAIPVPVQEVTVEEEDTIGVEVELDAVADAVDLGDSDYYIEGDGDFDGGAVFADDAFGYDPEPMAQAQTDSAQEIAQNTIARTELLSRGLRPSSRRFSGRGGRPALEIGHIDIEDAPIEAEGEDEVPTTEVESEDAVAVLGQETAAVAGRRLRTRRRRRSASGQITVVSDEAASITENDDEGEESTVGPEVAALVPAADTFGDTESPVSVEPVGTALESASEAPVGGVLPVEASDEAVAEVQKALDALEANVPASTEVEAVEVQPEGQDAFAGITVEAIAPELPAGSEEVATADPAGVPAVQATAEAPAKPKRRRPSRSKKATPVEESATPPVVEAMASPGDAISSETPPAVDSVSITTEALPVGDSEPTSGADAALATESTESVDALPGAEAAPAKPKRRRPSRAKKTEAAPAESGE
ncbi:hypothetical protein IAD21_03844 [Abditibacteriota bacterium]|nr:hypothetical protein IAD21_03844 [Abditibacteriota bacterium]